MEVNGTTKATFNGKEIRFCAKWQRLSMREAIIKYWPEESARQTGDRGLRRRMSRVAGDWCNGCNRRPQAAMNLRS